VILLIVSWLSSVPMVEAKWCRGIAHRHSAGVQADDHPVQAVQAALSLGYQHRGEGAVPVPRHVQVDIPDP